MSAPQPFGWRTSWIAVRSASMQMLIPELQLVRVRDCGWEEGLRVAYENGIFITPPVSGWILAVGVTLPDGSAEETLPLLVRLSEKDGSAQYFGNHRVVDYYAWAKAERGRLIRAFAFLGEKGVTLWDRGELTNEEVELGLAFDESPAYLMQRGEPQPTVLETVKSLNEYRHKQPEEQDVFAIARRWSIDPAQIEEYAISEGSGMLGYREGPRR